MYVTIILVMLALMPSVMFAQSSLLVSSEPATLVFAGQITKLSENEVTIAALNDPKFLKTFVIDDGTPVFKQNRTADRKLVEVGAVLIVKQRREEKGYRTERVDVLETRKP